MSPYIFILLCQVLEVVRQLYLTNVIHSKREVEYVRDEVWGRYIAKSAAGSRCWQ